MEGKIKRRLPCLFLCPAWHQLQQPITSSPRREREGSSGGVRKALPHSLEGAVRTSAAVSAIYILTFLGSRGQGVSLLFNTRIQVLFRVGGTPRTWEVASGLAGALGARVSPLVCPLVPQPPPRVF